MSIRKCIFTGKDSKLKDKVLPRPFLDEDELHNWANEAPISAEYKEIKGQGLPTELEMQIHETFKLLELARLRVKYYEAQLKELQENTPKVQKKEKKYTRSTKKEKQIQTAIAEHNAVQDIEKSIDKFLDEKRKMWE